MEIIKLDNLSKGLYLSGPADLIPVGFLRRYRGISALSDKSLLSRDGSTLIHTMTGTPHSAIFFNSKWYIAVATVLYEQTTSKITGLSGNRLSFAIMAPVAGDADYLFLAGGGALYKLDSSAAYTNWGIGAPEASLTTATSGAGALTGTYDYRVTFKNSITGSRSNPGAGADVGLLLHMDGVDEATTFTDSSDYAHAVTPAGNANTETGTKKFGTASCELDGTDDYLTVPDHPALNFGSSNFTVDFWVNFGTVDHGGGVINRVLFYKGTATGYIKIGLYASVATTYLYANCVVAGVTKFNATYTWTPSTSTWYHIALIRGYLRANSYIALFVDGSRVDYEVGVTGALTTPGTLYIGAGPGLTPMTGFIDEFRLVNNVAVWYDAFTAPAAAHALSTTVVAPSSNAVLLSGIPASADAQVDVVEIWRTVAGGDAFFKLTEIADGTTTFTDNLADDMLLSVELPTDNYVPSSYFDDCHGPWNGAMFWITRTQSGERGRLYYSPVGRAEAMKGFIEVTTDSDQLQRIVSYAGSLFVFSRSRCFQIYGTDPYYSRELPGVPGTTAPFTVVVSPYGIIWQSPEGVRLFTGGAQAQLVAYDQIAPIFRGRAIENLSSFTGVIATFARGEYIISTTSQSLALDIEKQRWRDLGLALAALAYDPINDVIGAALSTAFLNFEKEGDLTDNSAAIAIDIETGELAFDPPALIDLVRVDANANGETLTLTPAMNVSTAVTGTLATTAGRRFTELDLDSRLTNRLSLQITGSIDAAIEIFGIEVRYTPCVLFLDLGSGEMMTVPGRLSGDVQTLTFELFSLSQHSLQGSYVFERLFYDLDTASQNLVATLTLVGETAIALGTLNHATRTITEIAIQKKGRFSKLTLAGDFTKEIALRRIELVARATKAL